MKETLSQGPSEEPRDLESIKLSLEAVDHKLRQLMKKDFEKMTIADKKEMEEEVLKAMQHLKDLFVETEHNWSSELDENIGVTIRYLRGLLRKDGPFDDRSKSFYLGNVGEQPFFVRPEINRDELLREIDKYDERYSRYKVTKYPPK